MVIGRLEVFNTVFAPLSTDERRFPPIPRDGEHVQTAGAEHAGDLREAIRRIQDVLEDVLRDEQVERRVVERQARHVLAAHAVASRAGGDVGPVLRSVVALADMRAALGTGAVR